MGYTLTIKVPTAAQTRILEFLQQELKSTKSVFGFSQGKAETLFPQINPLTARQGTIGFSFCSSSGPNGAYMYSVLALMALKHGLTTMLYDGTKYVIKVENPPHYDAREGWAYYASNGFTPLSPHDRPLLSCYYKDSPAENTSLETANAALQKEMERLDAAWNLKYPS